VSCCCPLRLPAADPKPRAVYEYFISHHMAKAFESLFGSVTCLPGWCVPLARIYRATAHPFPIARSFTMYRIRSLEHKPLIIADAVIAEYGENKVETLHVKVRTVPAVFS